MKRTPPWLLPGLLLSSVCSAGTLERAPSLEELADQAPLSFHGTVVEVAHHGVDAPGQGHVPFTEARIWVEDAWAGAEEGQVRSLFYLGGMRIDRPGIFTAVSGMPELQEGVEVVVFADPSASPLSGALYGELGVYQVDQGTLRRRPDLTPSDIRHLVTPGGQIVPEQSSFSFANAILTHLESDGGGR